jgi:hypothetical protein
VLAVILADRASLPLAEIRSPAPPRAATTRSRETRASVVSPKIFFGPDPAIDVIGFLVQRCSSWQIRAEKSRRQFRWVIELIPGARLPAGAWPEGCRRGARNGGRAPPSSW